MQNIESLSNVFIPKVYTKTSVNVTFLCTKYLKCSTDNIRRYDRNSYLSLKTLKHRVNLMQNKKMRS